MIRDTRDAAAPDDGARLVEGSSVSEGQLVAEIIGEDARPATGGEAVRQHLQNADEEMHRRPMLFDRRLETLIDGTRARVVGAP